MCMQCRCGIGVGEVGVAGQGFAGLAVDEETDLGEIGEGGVQGADDGLEGESLGEDAGGMIGGEGFVEVDYRELTMGEIVAGCSEWQGGKEDVVYCLASGERMSGVG